MDEILQYPSICYGYYYVIAKHGASMPIIARLAHKELMRPDLITRLCKY